MIVEIKISKKLEEVVPHLKEEDLIERTKPEPVEVEKTVKEPELVVYMVDEKIFSTEEQADEFFNKYGGSLITKRTHWVGKILDVYKTQLNKELKR